jgi:hypothetical protein
VKEKALKIAAPGQTVDSEELVNNYAIEPGDQRYKDEK